MVRVMLVVLVLVASPAGAFETIMYSCKDPKTGHMSYLSSPCPPGAEQRVAQIVQHPESPVAEPPPQPAIGMSADEVLGLKGWSSPTKVNRTRTARGLSEQWVYRQGRWSGYLYFTNGVLTAIQD